MTKRDYEGPGNRLRQLERVLTIVEILAPRKYGLTTFGLQHEIADRLGYEFCERTIRRDLNALEMMGVVQQVRGNACSGDTFSGVRWEWVDRSLRATIYKRAAELRSA